MKFGTNQYFGTETEINYDWSNISSRFYINDPKEFGFKHINPLGMDIFKNVKKQSLNPHINVLPE